MNLLAKDRYDEYSEFLKTNKKGHFLQSLEWGAVKKEWTQKVIIVEDKDGKIKGSLAVLIRKMPIFGYTFMYAPRAPVCDISDKQSIKQLFDQVKELAKELNTYMLKVDPDVLAQNKEFVQIMEQIGFKLKNDYVNLEGVQARFVFRLDISGKTEQEVFDNFHSKTRYNIRLSIKKGVEVRQGTRDDLPEFYKIMLETGARDGFIIRPLEYFQRVCDSMGEHARIYCAYYEGKMVAGTIAINYGNKAWYLYGASSNKYRNVMPNYQLQWEMIKWAIQTGCDIYDFKGVPGDGDEKNPLYGLFRFKKGFNGTYTEFVGEFDYIFKPFVNKMINFAMKLRKLTINRFVLKKQKGGTQDPQK